MMSSHRKNIHYQAGQNCPSPPTAAKQGYPPNLFRIDWASYGFAEACLRLTTSMIPGRLENSEIMTKGPIA